MIQQPPDWLRPEARKIFAHILTKLISPSPEQVRMAAAYADALIHMQRYRSEPEKARIWRGAMIYARNGLGIDGPQRFIALLELLLDWKWLEEDAPISHLEDSWEIPCPPDYFDKPLNY